VNFSQLDEDFFSRIVWAPEFRIEFKGFANEKLTFQKCTPQSMAYWAILILGTLKHLP